MQGIHFSMNAIKSGTLVGGVFGCLGPADGPVGGVWGSFGSPTSFLDGQGIFVSLPWRCRVGRVQQMPRYPTDIDKQLDTTEELP